MWNGTMKNEMGKAEDDLEINAEVWQDTVIG